MTFGNYASELLRAVPGSFRETRATLIWGLGTLTALLLLLVLVSIATGRHTLYFFMDVPRSDGFGAGLATVISSFALVAAAVGLYARRRLSRGQADAADSGWLSLAALGAAWLAMDELLMLHERLTQEMDRAGIPKLFGLFDQDLLIFLGYAAAAALIGWKLMPLLYLHRRMIAPLVLTAVFYVSTQAVDVIPWNELTGSQQSVLGPLEEILKTMGSASFAIWGFLIVEQAARDGGTRESD